MRTLLRRLLAGTLLAGCLLGLPDGAVAPVTTELVTVKRARGLDVSPDVVWILALGSDARPGQSVLRSRADAIQLVGINTRTGAASAIGIPRDSWVNVPGHGSNRVNTGLFYGGPQLMARTVRGLVGIQPDYVMVSSFWGLRHMVDAIGGVTVQSAHAFSDPYLRPQGFRRGRNELEGMGALAFSRIRKDLPRGDFDRSANQQRTIRAIHRTVRAKADRPGFLDRGTLAVLRNMRTDVRPLQLFRLARAVAAVDPAKVRTCVLNGAIGNVGGASVVFPSRVQARRLGNDARRDATIGRC